MSEYKTVQVKLTKKEVVARNKKEEKERTLRVLGPINKILYLYFLRKIKKAKKYNRKYYIIEESESCPIPVANQLIDDGYKLFLEPSNPDFTRVKVCLGDPKKYAPNGSRMKKSIKQK